MDAFHRDVVLQRVRDSGAVSQCDVACVIARALDEMGYDLRSEPTLEETKQLLLAALLHIRPLNPAAHERIA